MKCLLEKFKAIHNKKYSGTPLDKVSPTIGLNGKELAFPNWSRFLHSYLKTLSFFTLLSVMTIVSSVTV